MEPTTYTDADLGAAEAGSSLGDARAAGYLRAVECPEARAGIVAEATIMTNVTAGWRYADAVQNRVAAYLRGEDPRRYRDLNARLIADDPHGFKAAGVAEGDLDAVMRRL